MVKSFQFARLPKIVFKQGGIVDLPGILDQFGKSILLVTGKNSFMNSDHGIHLIDSLKSKFFDIQHVTILDEPSPEDIDTAVNTFITRKIDVVVGIGGGSVLDAGKAISAMLYKSASVIAYLEGVGSGEHPGTKIPYIAVPTTSGTGSEATKNAVISKIGSGGFKKSLRHDNLVPDIALLDPELTITCSPELTAACGMDCFTQLTEAYLSVKSGIMSDALALEGLKAISASLKQSYLRGDDITARSGMSFAALASGICLANSGLGTVHGFASSLGGLYNIPHGVVCATLMAKTNEMNVKILRKSGLNPDALHKYSVLGKIFLGEKTLSDDYYIDGFIDYLGEMASFLNLPPLGRYGIQNEHIANICSITENKNNPVSFDKNQLSEILSQCI